MTTQRHYGMDWLLIAATTLGCWLFYAIGRTIGWLRPLIGLQRK